MSLLEALSHGLPAVVSPGVAQATPVAASGTGWVCEPSRLSALLGQVASDPELLNSARRRTKEMIANYRWDAVAAAYGELYASLLSS